MSQKIKTISLILGVFTMSLLVGFIVFGWVEPTALPPGVNVSAPVNVGSADQWKDGSLGLGFGGSQLCTAPCSELAKGEMAATIYRDTDNINNAYIDPSGSSHLSPGQTSTTLQIGGNTLTNYNGKVSIIPGDNALALSIKAVPTLDTPGILAFREQYAYSATNYIGLTAPTGNLGGNYVYTLPATDPATVANKFLRTDASGVLSWADPAGGVTGAVQFKTSTGIFGGDAATFFWDNTKKSLGIGIANPSANVGIDIGDEGPQTRGSIGAQTYFIKKSTATTNPPYPLTEAGGWIDVNGPAPIGPYTMYINFGILNTTDTLTGIAFSTPGGVAANKVRLFIQKGGNVGLSDSWDPLTTPSARLDVRGNVRIGSGGAVPTKVLCWTNTNLIGYCNGPVDAAGACGTCTAVP